MMKLRQAVCAVALVLVVAVGVNASPVSEKNLENTKATRPIDGSGNTNEWWMDRIDQRTGLDGTNNRAICAPGLGAGVDVYLLNYGCEYGHSDLVNQNVELLDTNLNTITPSAGSRDLSADGMGTFLASLIVGEDYGLAPAANLKCVQFPEEFGESKSSALEAMLVIRRLEALAQSGANPKIVVVMALNSRKALVDSNPILLFDNYIKAAADAGIVFVSTASDVVNTDGTPGNACSYAPSFSNEAINIAAFQETGDAFWTAGSSFNDGTESCIDFVAPGVSVTAAVGGGSALGTKSTNKAASALVGAVAALVANNWDPSFFQAGSGYNPTDRFRDYLNSPTPATSAGSGGTTYPIAYLRCTGPPGPTGTPAPVVTGTPTPTPVVTPTPSSPPINADYDADCAAAYNACNYVLEIDVGGTKTIYDYSDPTMPGSDQTIDLKPCSSGCTDGFTVAGQDISFRVRAKTYNSGGLSGVCEPYFSFPSGISGISTDWTGRTDYTDQAEILANVDDGNPSSAPWTPMSNVIDYGGFPKESLFYSQYYLGTSPVCPSPGPNELNVLYQQDSLIPSAYQAKMDGRCYKVYISDIYLFNNNPIQQSIQDDNTCFAFRASGTLLPEDPGFTV
uniref:Peptidase S8/S53 domain-containing protein n=1 Tax=Erythrolobus madagascarensis TaxID=708628 RepID=A0A7S0XHQ5_9RHOD|mmetsp:Transcript_1896/g.4164  ORF Transcript_1896/g.4164 Transcript_1896/m.4164 type:complete len:622 (+) Transcript_1896:113-1978(+)